jgi:predicted MFS family arabinose efflux permease
MNGYRFDSLKRLTYVNGLFIVGTLGTLISPAILESWAARHWSQSQLGFIAALELTTLGLGSMSGLFWQRRWSWRGVALVALLLAVLANLACVILDDFVDVCLSRGVAGLSSGFLCALYSAFLANTRSPNKVFAVTTFIQIGLQALFVYGASSVFRWLGVSGLFVLMIALSLMLIPLLRLLPRGWPTDNPASTPAAVSQHQPMRGLSLVLAFIPYIMVQAGIYTFLGEFGRLAANLDSEQTLRAVGISVVFSSLGAVGSYVLSNRAGFLMPIASAILMTAGMMFAVVFASRSVEWFIFNISLLQIAWIFLGCYLYSSLVHINNLLVTAATSLSSFGSACGASAVGLVLEHDGIRGTLILTTGALSLTALLALPCLWRSRLSDAAASATRPKARSPLSPGSQHDALT